MRGKEVSKIDFKIMQNDKPAGSFMNSLLQIFE